MACAILNRVRYGGRHKNLQHPAIFNVQHFGIESRRTSLELSDPVQRLILGLWSGLPSPRRLPKKRKIHSPEKCPNVSCDAD
jgi:hypothetical protein